jgi:hypothetical protein
MTKSAAPMLECGTADSTERAHIYWKANAKAVSGMANLAANQSLADSGTATGCPAARLRCTRSASTCGESSAPCAVTNHFMFRDTDNAAADSIMPMQVRREILCRWRLDHRAVRRRRLESFTSLLYDLATHPRSNS